MSLVINIVDGHGLKNEIHCELQRVCVWVAMCSLVMSPFSREFLVT